MKSLLVLLAITAVTFAGTYTSDWSLHDLVQHLEDPNLDPEYRPYLEAALDDMMAALMNGETMDAISITLPLSPVITPTPSVPSVPVPPVTVTPGNPSAPAPASSPLVQIMVNVNNKQQEQIAPEHPEIIDVPAVKPPQVIVVDQAPETVVVVENPPESINIVEQPENPIDIIAVSPPEVTNPADMFPLPIHPGH